MSTASVFVKSDGEGCFSDVLGPSLYITPLGFISIYYHLPWVLILFTICIASQLQFENCTTASSASWDVKDDGLLPGSNLSLSDLDHMQSSQSEGRWDMFTDWH